MFQESDGNGYGKGTGGFALERRWEGDMWIGGMTELELELEERRWPFDSDFCGFGLGVVGLEVEVDGSAGSGSAAFKRLELSFVLREGVRWEVEVAAAVEEVPLTLTFSVGFEIRARLAGGGLELDCMTEDEAASDAFSGSITDVEAVAGVWSSLNFSFRRPRACSKERGRGIVSAGDRHVRT